MDCSLPGSSVHGDSPGKKTGVGCHALFQGIFPTQRSNPGLSHCRWILYLLSHKRSPRIQEWVAYPFPGDLPNPGMELGSPALQVDSLPAELPGSPIFLEHIAFPLLISYFIQDFAKLSPSLYLSLSHDAYLFY